ncbi:MAG: right-handed parallel beta-helix repeat-containing protein [Clostridia bacterium]|nr:right-handed parallel beta-helix repeat-containing protein [Clostridia bacterium]
MSRIKSMVLALLLLVGTLPSSVVAEVTASVQMELYVSPIGNDLNSGTQSAPFLTVERAVQEVQKHNKNMTGNIIVNIAPGRYELDDRIRLRAEDSGSNGYDIIYRGDRENMPVISGGRVVTGWQKGENGIWHAKAEHLDFARDLYVNDAMGIRAQTQDKISGIRNYKNADGMWTGFYVSKSQLGFLENSEDVQLHWAVTWKSQYGNVQDIIPDPENPDNVIVLMEEGFWEGNVKDTGVSAHGTADIGYPIEFEVQNAYELLDEPGEFYFNKKTKILSYMPRDGEDMTTAEVICPQEDQLMLVSGVDYDNRIHNVRFEDICFAHSSFSAMEHGYVGGQGEVLYSMGGGSEGRAIKGGVEVKWADEIDFYSCRFFGEASTALCLPEGVHNCEIIGNVFTDLGSSAITVGNAMQMDFVEPQAIEGPTNIMWRKGYTASNYYGDMLGISWRAISDYGSYVDTSDSATVQQSLKPGWGWRSTENVLEKGIYPWIKIDLDSEYSIDSIRLSFEDGQSTGKVSSVERSNFEVLASNDKDFKEYEVLGTVTDPASVITTIDGTDNKYRFVMLRKTKLEPFALTGIWIYSYDIGPSGQRGAPTNITIANNYIQRPAMVNTQGLGILAYYTKNMVIEHNEIYDAPYSAISFGWNWRNPQTTGGGNKVNYNRIHNVMRYTNDGGGIYHLGTGPKDELVGNYISRLDGNQGFAMYMDEGSTETTWKDNVVLESSTTAHFATYSYNCTIDGIWSDVGVFDNLTNSLREEETHVVKNDHIIDITNPPEEAARIMANAGLTEEFEYIRERVPQNEYPLMKGPYTQSPCLRVYDGKAVRRVQYFIGMASNIVDSGRFGDLPWLYAPEFKYTLQYHIDRLRGTNNSTDDISGGRIEEQSALRDEIERAYDSVKHPEWDEMLAMCDKKISEAKVGNALGSYPEKAIQQFKEKYEAVKATNPQTKADKFVAVLELEEAYEALEAQKFAADITYVYVEDGETEIDKAQKIVNITLPAGVDLSFDDLIVETSANARVAADLKEAGHKISVRVPVLNVPLGEYDFWTITIKNDDFDGAEMGTIKAETEKWYTANPNTDLVAHDGKITLQPWFDATMYTTPMKENVSFDVWAERPDVNEGIGFIFSSQTKDLERKGLYEKNTYYELNIKGQNAELYQVVAGVRTKCTEVDCSDFKYGDFNRVDINIIAQKATDSVKISLNGKQILDTLINDGIGSTGYFGVFNKHQKLIIKGGEQ